MSNYDAIIVGARCGGAPLAMLLARAGHKVLLLDRTAFGSDIMSTHFLKRTGASRLNNWGLLDKVKAAGTPEITDLQFNINGAQLQGQAPPYDGVGADYTPRRFILDKILVDAAIEAGVEARDNFTVTELVFNGDRVVGIKGAAKGGSEVTEMAKVVVGADGPNSLVANAVKAPKYIDAGTYTCGYYGYFSGMRDRSDAAELHVLTDEKRFYISFPTNDDLDMVFLFWGADQARDVRKNLDTAFYDSLKLVPSLEARVQKGTLEGRFSGTHMLPNYFRRAHGPGWALVGDAALHRDPITAQGITNAFTHAEILGEELNKALGGEKDIDAALADYDARQLEVLKPMFDYTVHLSMFKPIPEQIEQMMPVIMNDPMATAGFLGAFMGSVPLDAVFPPELIEGYAADVAAGHAATMAAQ